MLFEEICSVVHPEIEKELQKSVAHQHFGKGTENIIDYAYSDLGEGSSKTLFVKLDGGWVYMYSYCKQDVEQTRSFEVFHPNDIAKLQSIL